MTPHPPDITDIHQPEPSFWPVVLAAGVVMMAAGVLWTPVITALGLAVLLIAIAGWTQENRVHSQEEDTDHV
jgi:cytochrome c oxidase subunit 1